MKVAVLVFGVYREFDIAVKSWEFLNELDCDVYFSTWDKSFQENKNMNITIDEVITEDKIRNHIPNATIDILNEQDFPHLNTSTKKMINHMKNSLRLMKESGKYYDQIMMVRPDAFIKVFFPFSKFETLKEKDRIYGCEWIQLVGKDWYTMDDTFLFGDCEVITKFIEGLPLDTVVHHGFVMYTISLGLYVQKIELGSSIVRPNCRYRGELTFNDIATYRNEWFECFHGLRRCN